MTNCELNLLQSAMNNSKNYLEFGSGNSTYMAVTTNTIEKITVVESDAVFWGTHILTMPVIKEAVNQMRLHPHLVDIGDTAKWGYPINGDKRDNWPLYHSCAFQSNDFYDTILVDGRFRISCILHACIYSTQYQYTKILIHDFFNRPIYHVVLPFLTLEQRTDTLGLFSIKRNEALMHLAEEYISIYEYLPGF